jgi:hypothetical protein
MATRSHTIRDNPVSGDHTMPKTPAKKAPRFAQKTAPKLKQPKTTSTPRPVTRPVPPPWPTHPVSSVVHAPPVQTEAEKIWDQIRNLPIQMFGLPGQVVAMHATPFPIEPTKLYLTIRSSATLPSLETAVGDGFTVEQADRFVIVARKAAPLFPQVRK